MSETLQSDSELRAEIDEELKGIMSFDWERIGDRDREDGARMRSVDRIMQRLSARDIAREKEIRMDAERTGAAFAIMVIDQLHIGRPDFSDTTDRLFKGIKNDIRTKFQEKTGIDPAPNYPVKVTEATLTQPSNQKSEE